jgi:hypothetical protein
MEPVEPEPIPTVADIEWVAAAQRVRRPAGMRCTAGRGWPVVVAMAAIVAVGVPALRAIGAPRPLPQMQGVPFPESDGEIATWGEGDSFEDIFESVEVRASTALAPEAGTSYAAACAHDGNVNTAWAPAKNGRDGVGDFLEFTLRRAAQTEPNPSLDGMVVFNGYRKSRVLWQENNRVRRLAMSVNGRPYGVITLADAYVHQRVSWDAIPLPAPPRTTVVRFTIAGVYHGTKFHDTAISEIGFKGNGIY